MNSNKSNLRRQLLFPLILCWSVILTSQTPWLMGWHSLNPMPMSQQICFDKAVDALKAAGLENIATQEGWTASATSNIIRAGISCVKVQEGILIDISVAGDYPNGGETREMRDFLMNYMMGNGEVVTPSTGGVGDLPSGSYQTDLGTLVLIKNGNKVTGTYEGSNGSLEGTLKGNVLTGTWRNVHSNKHGPFVFTFSGDFTSFTGRWNYDNNTPSKKWNGTLTRPSSNEENIETRLSGSYLTDLGELIFEIHPAGYVGKYENGNGILVGTLKGRVLSGNWQNLATHKDGIFKFTFNSSFSEFTGYWGYGNGPMDKKWNGKKK